MDKPQETLTNPPPLLLDMRTAYETLPEANEPPGLRLQRQVMKDKPNDFLDRMTALEKAWLAKETAAIQAKAEREARETAAIQEPEEEVDEGSERCLAILKDWLERHQ
jgi:hypothetical protein